MQWLRTLFGRKPASSATTPNQAPPQAESVSVESPFSSDEPITSKTQDRFKRAAFSARIAETIVRRADPSSIVIGLFGAWGDGKTSVMKMMEESLNEYQRVITIRFNPWHFPSEDALLRGFFASLSEALGKEPAFKEKAAALLERYGGVLSVVSVSLPGVEVNPGEAAKNIGESLSRVNLARLKDEIDRLLDASGKRLVILIDDIDRLDRDETHAIFKLVKLSASFRHTCYVLAFDDEVVAAALGERYGAGGQAAGRAFLEKIIQVPLHLPPADRISLRQIAFEGVDLALRQADIALDQRQVDVFTRHFVDGLEPKLETPRLAKLYGNALMFALPLVKGEVNIAEFMLVEGLRVLYPQLYAAIRDAPELFLQGEDRQTPRNLEPPRSPIADLVEMAMPAATAEERERVRERLLKPLFPRTGNSMYGSEWEEEWAAKQRICSGRYFKRYFVYGVPEGDVSDSQIAALVESLAVAEPSGQRDLLTSYPMRAMPQLIAQIRDRADDLGESSALPLALAVARNGDLFPRERGPNVFGGTITQAGILIASLMRRIPLEQRQAAVEGVLQVAEPLAMGMECVRWLTHASDRTEEYRVLPDEADDAVYRLFADRVRAASTCEPLFLQFGRDAPNLYWYWQRGRGRAEVELQLRQVFDSKPESVDQFLDTYVGEGWEIESGLPVRSDLRRNSYDDIASVISPEYVLANLRSRYGSELDDPQYRGQGSIARRIAHQFAFIHRAVLNEQSARGNAESSK